MAVAAARRLQPACDMAIAVLRPGNDTLGQLLKDEGFQIVVCDQSQFGMGHSLAAGVRSTPDAAGWIVALGDMPFITPDIHRRVAAALRGGASIAAPEMGGRRGHPVGFSKQWFDKLSALTGDAGAGSLLSASPTEIFRCDVNDPAIFRDIDSLADL